MPLDIDANDREFLSALQRVLDDPDLLTDQKGGGFSKDVVERLRGVSREDLDTLRRLRQQYIPTSFCNGS